MIHNPNTGQINNGSMMSMCMMMRGIEMPCLSGVGVGSM